MSGPLGSPCPDWHYSDQHGFREALRREHRELIQGLNEGLYDAETHGCDSRSVHSKMFLSLTPTGHEYFAGNYRGADIRCLRDSRVGVGADPLVGWEPERVWEGMLALADGVRRGVAALDRFPGGDEMQSSTRLVTVVQLAARVFQEFLTVHPYKDGNGHIGRFLVWLILMRYGYRPARWTIEPRPRDARYSTALSSHRRGSPAVLEELILKSIIG